MKTRSLSQVQAAPKLSFTPVNSGLLQRKCACGKSSGLSGECSECQSKGLTLQRRSRNQAEPEEVPPIVHEVLRSPGQPLNLDIRAFMEPRFGHDFSQVRVHTDVKAAESARAVNALAYTVGQDVVFGAGQYAPGMNEGKQLIAHELTHVVQQWGTAQREEGIGGDHHPSEQEADTIANNVIANTTTTNDTSPLQVSLMSIPVIQRKPPQKQSRCDEVLANDPYPGTVTGEQIDLFTLSDEGFDFLVRHEGLKQRLYNDSQGHCTIGIGHLVHRGNCNGSETAEFRAGITEDRALELFRADLGQFEEIVHYNVIVRINQAQYDALVSFTFNTGSLPGTNVLRELNLGCYSRVPEAMMQWLKPPEIRGRRTDEAKLFRTENY